MRYLTGNILDYIGRPDAICITTNGFVTSKGNGVMGMGIAKSMSDKYPELPKALGVHIKRNGNHVGLLMQVHKTKLLSFPVKPGSIIMSDPAEIVSHARGKYSIGLSAPGFHCVASVELIRRSCQELVAEVNKAGYKHVLLPVPGCGAGELSFNKDGIREICESALDDRFFMMSFKLSDFGR